MATSIVLAASSCVGEARGERGSEATVDRSVPMSEMIERFNAGEPVVKELTGGMDSRDALIAELVQAIKRADTGTLSQLAVSRAEWGQLYFPTSRYATAPYELPPEIAYMLSASASEKGLSRLLQRLGGRDLAFQGYRCAESAVEDRNRYWSECTLQYELPGEERLEHRLFQALIERDGKYKILSFANDF
jgi:hypothetical protein